MITEDEIRQHWNNSLPLVSAIMLVHDKPALTKRALETFLTNTTYPSYELFIIDNASGPHTRNLLETFSLEHPHVQVIRNEHNASFSASNNQGAAQSSGSLLLFLNNDTEFHDPAWLTQLVGELVSRPGCAAVGPRLVYPLSGQVQSAGVAMVLDRKTGSFREAREIRRPRPSRLVDGLTAACLLIRKDVFEALGGFDEQFVYGQEDVDLCLTLRTSGYALYHCAEVSVIHHEQGTRSIDERTARNRRLIQQKWYGGLKDFVMVDLEDTTRWNRLRRNRVFRIEI